MTTLRAPRLEDCSPDDRARLDALAKRMGQTTDQLLGPHIFGVQ